MTAMALQPGTASAIIAGVATIVAAWLALRSSRRTKEIEAKVAEQAQQIQAQVAERGQTLEAQTSSYTQLQKDVEGLRKELADQKRSHAEEMATLRKDLAASQRRERAVEGYAWDLRRYIERGEGPPPPDWPEELEDR